MCLFQISILHYNAFNLEKKERFHRIKTKSAKLGPFAEKATERMKKAMFNMNIAFGILFVFVTRLKLIHFKF